MIPLGGYVQMKGQDDKDPTKVSFDTDSYNTKAPWKRIIILFAGPFANFFISLLTLYGNWKYGCDQTLPYYWSNE